MSSILLWVWQCNLPPVLWQSLMSTDNAATESVKASGAHIQIYAKTTILCEERTGSYCITFDWCQTVGIGLDDSWVQWKPSWIPTLWIYRLCRWRQKRERHYWISGALCVIEIIHLIINVKLLVTETNELQQQTLSVTEEEVEMSSEVSRSARAVFCVVRFAGVVVRANL